MRYHDPLLDPAPNSPATGPNRFVLVAAAVVAIVAALPVLHSLTPPAPVANAATPAPTPAPAAAPITVDGLHAAAQPAPTTSHYLAFVGPNPAANRTKARTLACTNTGKTPGLVTLSFGRQHPGGAQAFGPAGTIRPYSHLADIVAAYSDALTRCAGPGWTIAVKTSNHKLVDPAIAATYGADWARFVGGIAGRLPTATIVAAWDVEPGFGTYPAAQAWLRAYTTTTTIPVVLVASADGCPRTGPGRCNNGWSTGGLAQLAWNTAPTVTVMPQIYTRNGAQADQWAIIARTAALLGFNPRLYGVTTQTQACTQVTDPACATTNNTPDAARTQLAAALQRHPNTRSLTAVAATDMAWAR